MLRPRLVNLGAALAAGGLVAGASAAGAQEISIRYRPYELATFTGAQAVLARAEHAAERACRPPLGEAPRSQASCRKDLTGQIVAGIDHPRVTALWRTATPGVELASRSR